MKTLLSMAIFSSVLLLSACEGDSDSSGEEFTDDPSHYTIISSSNSHIDVGDGLEVNGMECDTGGEYNNRVYVVDSCYYTPKGATHPRKYTCNSDGTITTNGNTFPHNSTFQGVTYHCQAEH